MKSSNKRRKIVDKEIILNYGIEIESVFELINQYIAYNQFIYSYLNNDKSEYLNKLKNFIYTLNISINTLEEDEDKYL